MGVGAEDGTEHPPHNRSVCYARYANRQLDVLDEDSILHEPAPRIRGVVPGRNQDSDVVSAASQGVREGECASTRGVFGRQSNWADEEDIHDTRSRVGLQQSVDCHQHLTHIDVTHAWVCVQLIGGVIQAVAWYARAIRFDGEVAGRIAPRPEHRRVDGTEQVNGGCPNGDRQVEWPTVNPGPPGGSVPSVRPAGRDWSALPGRSPERTPG